MKNDLQCKLIDESHEYSLRELCRMCRVHARFIEDLIEEGIIEPKGSHPGEWRFAAIEIKRVQISIRLQNDLRVNLPGTALAINLLEEIDELRRSKQLLEQFHALERNM